MLFVNYFLFFLLSRPPPTSTLFPYTTLFRSLLELLTFPKSQDRCGRLAAIDAVVDRWRASIDRKSTRLNSSHTVISYAVFCLKKKNQHDGPEAGHREGCRRGGRERRQARARL